MNALPYSIDFPCLIKVPAASYLSTLELDGMEPDEAKIYLLTLDVLVKLAVEKAGYGLACRAPENIFIEDVANKLGYHTDDLNDPVDRAIVNKSTLILRGEMQPNPIWSINDKAA